MKKYFGLQSVVLMLISRFCTAAPFPSLPLAISAEYYFNRHDYRKSYELFLRVSELEPSSVFALLRVGELKLLFEGRTASRDLLFKFLESPVTKQSADARREVRDKLKLLESTFVTDEGQSLFLQALSRIKRQDCAGAVALFDHAAQLENGNLQVFLERGKCEKVLGLFDRYYETIKLAYSNNPYDREVIESLVDGQLYFKQYAQAVEVLQKTPEVAASISGKTALALSLAETGKSAEALPLLQSIMEQQKQSGFQPILLYAVGQILAQRHDASVEAASYLERFLGAAESKDAVTLAGWDPYHYQDNIESAKALLARTKGINRL